MYGKAPGGGIPNLRGLGWDDSRVHETTKNSPKRDKTIQTQPNPKKLHNNLYSCNNSNKKRKIQLTKFPNSSAPRFCFQLGFWGEFEKLLEMTAWLIVRRFDSSSYVRNILSVTEPSQDLLKQSSGCSVFLRSMELVCCKYTGGLLANDTQSKARNFTVCLECTLKR